MTDRPYDNREIDRMFGEIKEQLDRIETQTRKTNGRVTALQAWRTGIVMSIAVFAFIVIPLIVYIYTTQVESFHDQFKTINK